MDNNVFKKDIKNQKIDKNLLYFLEDVCCIQDNEILNNGIWPYIIKNQNYKIHLYLLCHYYKYGGEIILYISNTKIRFIFKNIK